MAPKFLRYLAMECSDAQGRMDSALWSAISAAIEVAHLPWMYEHYAFPIASNGVAKIFIRFTAFPPESANAEPRLLLDVVEVGQHLDAERLAGLPPRERQHYLLDQIHAAVLRCAEPFGLDPQALEGARQRIIDDDFNFVIRWKKPLTSPDRRTKVQAIVQVSPFPARLYLAFFDKQQQEIRRVLLSQGTDGPGVVEAALGEIRWDDAQTVRVTNLNGRDYWRCNVEGEVAFHAPRAESGDPQGEFELGRMYWEGRIVLPDRDRALALIESAAAKGYKHAQNFLARQQKTAEP